MVEGERLESIPGITYEYISLVPIARSSPVAPANRTAWGIEGSRGCRAGAHAGASPPSSEVRSTPRHCRNRGSIRTGAGSGTGAAPSAVHRWRRVGADGPIDRRTSRGYRAPIWVAVAVAILRCRRRRCCCCCCSAAGETRSAGSHGITTYISAVVSAGIIA